jgi:hypothetical protein
MISWSIVIRTFVVIAAQVETWIVVWELVIAVVSCDAVPFTATFNWLLDAMLPG